MTKHWKHEVSIDWLQARRDVLTASEIKGLLPEYKRQLKKKSGEISPGFFALCGAKLSTDIPDPESTGAAARGHIMEPYAVADWNFNNPKCKYHHWDDVIIKRNGLGFSPDALDIEQKFHMGVELWVEDNKLILPNNHTMSWMKPKRALEVKCYEPKTHMKGYLTSKEDREERLQVAVAFMVVPGLKHVDILWYCPEAPVPMYSERYKRNELKAEIDVITGMVKMFHEHMDKIPKGVDPKYCMQPHYTTEGIYQEWLQEYADTNSVIPSLR